MANAQLRKTLMEACTYETELEAEAASLRANLITAYAHEATLESLLDKEKKVNKERLAQLETIADDSVLSARVELM